MKEYHLFYAPDMTSTQELPADEAAHAVRVLRMKEGDQLLATDGRGHVFECHLTLASPKHCKVNIDSISDMPRGWKGNIHIAVAPTKNMDRMEWFAEKATEIGIDRITFLDCKNSERHVLKTERIERIVVSATKQSHKAWKPEVSEQVSFGDFISKPQSGKKFIAHCYETQTAKPHLLHTIGPGEDVTVLIGPEGDFSLEEVKMAEAAGYKAISLGESRLRTETAALVATHIAALILSNS